MGDSPQLFLQGQLHPYGQVMLFWRGLQAHAKLGNSNRGRLYMPGAKSPLEFLGLRRGQFRVLSWCPPTPPRPVLHPFLPFIAVAPP